MNKSTKPQRDWPEARFGGFTGSGGVLKVMRGSGFRLSLRGILVANGHRKPGVRKEDCLPFAPPASILAPETLKAGIMEFNYRISPGRGSFSGNWPPFGPNDGTRTAKATRGSWAAPPPSHQFR